MQGGGIVLLLIVSTGYDNTEYDEQSQEQRQDNKQWKLRLLVNKWLKQNNVNVFCRL